MVENSLAFFSRRFKDRGISFEIAIPPDLPQVRGDGSRLQQVLINLLINAEEAMENQVAAKIIHLTASLDSAGVVLTVCDTGSGVPEGIRDRIFDPFYTTKAPNRGTGLGLSISRSIVESHGGSLRVTTSEKGHGACFQMTLPTSAATKETTKTETTKGKGS
jgi:signal transduction histidine kinase